MIKPIAFLFCWLLLSLGLTAQPGGGGGLSIKELYDSNLQRIDSWKNPDLTIRRFLLGDSNVCQETFFGYADSPDHHADTYRTRYCWPDGYGGIGLIPPTRGMYIDGLVEPNGGSFQRMMIMYQADTMIIDFMVIGENGIGHSDHIDSLVIQEGYIRAYGESQNGDFPVWSEDDRRLRSHGITPYTVKRLSVAGHCVFRPGVDTSFLDPDILPASYYTKRAAYHLEVRRPEVAVQDLSRGTEKRGGLRDCETLILLTEAYHQLEQWDSAISCVTQVIQSRFWGYLPYHEYIQLGSYRVRARLLAQQGAYDLALADYNILLRGAKHDDVIERALFIMDAFQDYELVIAELTEVIDSIPDRELNGCDPMAAYLYADEYFTLGLAAYQNGQQERAFYDWLKAVDWGVSSSRFRYFGINDVQHHLDSMIQRHPHEPMLYLTRGILQLRFAAYTKGRAERKYLNACLKDLKQAEKSGMKAFQLFYYRAIAFKRLGFFTLALHDINKAIESEDVYPNAYLERYYIREGLGQTGDVYGEDPDVITYKARCPTYRYPR